jgi:hypothetical protein
MNAAKKDAQVSHHVAAGFTANKESKKKAFIYSPCFNYSGNFGRVIVR